MFMMMMMMMTSELEIVNCCRIWSWFYVTKRHWRAKRRRG